MKTYSAVITLVVGIFLFSCASEDAAKKNIETTDSKSTTTQPTQQDGVKSSSGRDMTHMRGSALSILDHRISEDTEKSYSIIDADIWEYQFVHDGKKMSEKGSYDGKWLDFKEDSTYEYGTYDKKEGGGKYHYNFSDQVVLMIDNDKTKNPEEWNIKFGSNVMIMIGTAVYGNNNFQKKLIRKKGLDDLAQ